MTIVLLLAIPCASALAYIAGIVVGERRVLDTWNRAAEPDGHGGDRIVEVIEEGAA